MGAVQWLPALALLGAGGGATVHGLRLARLVELILPGAFGASDPDRAVAAIAGGSPWAPSLYVGAPLLALGAVRPPGRRILAVVVGLAAAALIVGRGGWPAWLGAPELHVAALAIVLAANAGVGLDALVAGERRAIVALGVGAACAAIALGALGALRGGHRDAQPAIDRALVDGGLGIACMVAALALALFRRGERSSVRLALISVLAIAPGAGAIPSTLPTLERASVDEPAPWVELATGAAQDRAAAPPRRLYRPAMMTGLSERADDAVATLAGTSPARFGLAAARSDDPARLPAHDQVWIAAANGGDALLERYGIAISILPSGIIKPRKITELARRGNWSLAVLPVQPAAAVMFGWQRAVAVEDALALLFPASDRGTVVLGAAGDSHDAHHRPPTPCAIDRWEPGDQELTCTAADAAYAVVSSTPADGWSVTVDGEAASWVPADVLRRAVAISAGTHHIAWSYRVPWFRTGLLLSLAGIAALVALARGRPRP
jgi:hypothetical protein